MTEENFNPLPQPPTLRELDLTRALEEIRETLGACKVTLSTGEVIYAPFYIRRAVAIIEREIGAEPFKEETICTLLV